MPAADKWSKDALSSISATPYSLHTPREPEVVFRDATDAQRPQLDPKVALSRQVYIKPADIERFGLTRGCPKSDHDLNYGPRRTSKGHSKACRDRIMGEMSKTADGRARIAAAAAARLDQTVAELGQQHRTDLSQGEMADATTVGQSQPVIEPPQFLPMSTEETIRPPNTETSESREVPPPADDARLGETHDQSYRDHGMLDTGYEQCADGQEIPGMEIDVVTEQHSDLSSLMSVLTREERRSPRGQC